MAPSPSHRILLPASLALMILAHPAHASWPPAGAPVCVHPANQYTPRVASDGSGGAYVIWKDHRNYGTTDQDLYAQHIMFSGELAPGWPASGVPVCTAPGPQAANDPIPDGEGGLYVTWQDRRSLLDDDIYVQRLNPSGALAPGWPEGGLRITTLPYMESDPKLAPDGAGGVFVTWKDSRDRLFPTNESDLYALRLHGDGTVADGWPENGLPIATGPLTEFSPVLLADGTGGVVIVWLYGVRQTGDTYDLRGVRITGSGEVAPGWTAGGKSLFGPPANGVGFRLVSDGAGGYYIAWEDIRSAPPGTSGLNVIPYLDIYALRLTATGDPAPGWPGSGMPVCTLPQPQAYVALDADGTGGCFVAWGDYRDAGTNASDLYAMRLLGNGTVAPGWTAQGTRLGAEYGYQLFPWAVADGVGGVYLVYEELADEGNKVLALRVSGGGQVAAGWPPLGRRLAQGIPGSQSYPRVTSDGMGGVIVAWEDGRDAMSSGNIDIYAQRIGLDGPVPALISLAALEVEPGWVRLTWHAVDGAVLLAHVERRTASGEWGRLGAITADGSGTLRYEDRTVTPGARYGYRLAYAERDGDAFTRETWVTVPALAFELRGPIPNPSAGVPVIGFSLATAEPATLELFDLHGRLVESREVGSLGAGTHFLRLGERTRLAAGVYTVRLRQGASLASQRAVVVR